MEVQIAVAKAPKYGLGESGDTVEVVERLRGGVSAIMADGQTHGRAAKRISHLVVAKAQQLIGDGVRDGAVARGVHDYLFAIRDGKVSAELTMVSVDFRSKSLVVTRNSHVPVFLRQADGRVERLDQYVEPIGVHEIMKPIITEIPAQPGLVVLAFTDGVQTAGKRYGAPFETEDIATMVAAAEPHRVRELADGMLQRALDLDQRRPADDMTVLAVGLSDLGNAELIRRMTVSMPL